MEDILDESARLEAALEDAQKNNEEKKRAFSTMKNIMDSLNILIYVVVPETGEILFINDKMRKSFGIEGDAGIGKYCYKLFRGAECRCAFCPCSQLGGEPDKTVEWEEYVPNFERDACHPGSYIDWLDGTKGYLQYTYDTTELIRAIKQAEQSSRIKSDFLAKMSHEIRTPMNAIIGIAELVLREETTLSVRSHVSIIKQAGVNLLSIINDILDFSKIESGKLEIAVEEYTLSSLVQDIINIIRTRVSDSRLRFWVNIDSDIPNTLIGDETRIRQSVLNLLSNAVKYTENGFVSFSINGKIAPGNIVVLSIEVADSGKGIKEEDLPILFGNFVQLDAAKSKNIEGTGLGLAITRYLVEAMGGEIAVSSKYGEGSIFTITLPQKIFSAEKLASVEKAEEKNVLIYERREVCVDSILQTMADLGVRCTLVKTASDFCEKLSGGEYSFAFIAANLYKSVKETRSVIETNSRIILIADFGESTFLRDLTVLYTPIYAIPVANILNGVPDKFINGHNNSTAKFTAPSAKVLIVDDINTNLKVAEGLLLQYRIQVDLCSSGKEAIEAIKSKKYDLVFMDHKMPEMDGIETTKYIRALSAENPYYKYVPIIALTANAVSGAREMFLKNEIDDFLSKPIDTVKLNAILEKWIPEEKRGNSARENDEASIEITNTSTENIDGEGVNIINEPGKELSIEGVNVKKGVMLCGGKFEDYLEMLAVFLQDGLDKIHEIGTSLKAGNLHLYVIYVHALKSAAAVIGADELSRMAKDLEAAGNRKDMAYIQMHNDELLSALKSLTNDIGEALKTD